MKDLDDQQALKDAALTMDRTLQRLQAMKQALSRILDEQDRDAIGQAQGILMERYSISAAQAHLLLAATSHSSNSPRGQTAANLISTGQLPGPDT